MSKGHEQLREELLKAVKEYSDGVPSEVKVNDDGIDLGLTLQDGQKVWVQMKNRREVGGGDETFSVRVLADTTPAPARTILWLGRMLLAPAERRNWLGELRTARWEAQGDRRELRRVTRSFLRGLPAAAVVSWRHGQGPARPEPS